MRLLFGENRSPIEKNQIKNDKLDHTGRNRKVFQKKVSSRHAQQYGHERINGGFAWHGAKYSKIIIQRGFSHQSSHIGEGEMGAAFDDVPPVRRFLETVGINPDH